MTFTLKAITFDVGNTLLFPSPSIPETFMEVCTHHNIFPDESAVYEAMPQVYQLYTDRLTASPDFWCSSEDCKQSWYDQYNLLFNLVGLGEHAANLVPELYKCYLRGHHWGVFQDVLPTLQGLYAKGIKLAVVSNWGPELPQILEDLKLDMYFSSLVVSANVGYCKPERQIFREALESLQVAPENTLHVGDLLDADGLGAQSAGILPVIIDRSKSIENNPFVSIDNLTELLTLI